MISDEQAPYGGKGCTCWPGEDWPDRYQPNASCRHHGLLAGYSRPRTETGTYRVVQEEPYRPDPNVSYAERVSRHKERMAQLARPHPEGPCDGTGVERDAHGCDEDDLADGKVRCHRCEWSLGWTHGDVPAAIAAAKALGRHIADEHDTTEKERGVLAAVRRWWWQHTNHWPLARRGRRS